MLPAPQQALAPLMQLVQAPLNMLNSLAQGAQRSFEEGVFGPETGKPDIRQRRDVRAGIPIDVRETQAGRINQMTDQAGIYVYVRPGAPAGSKGTIIF
jgi:hypothetical protein